MVAGRASRSTIRQMLSNSQNVSFACSHKHPCNLSAGSCAGEVIDVVIQNNQASSFNGSGGIP
jgi:hypothetical protein